MQHIYIEIGDIVLCDYCNKDYTDLPGTGGILFGSYAICPACEPRATTEIKKCNEEHLIKQRCPSDKSFADWVRQDLR